ncbi:MAG: cation transporter [Minisyncoccia bacterium]
MIQSGHLAHCSSPASPCVCEGKLYTTTGILALIAGLVQWIVGYKFSMMALSDSMHAISDSFADFVGVYIAKKVLDKPHRAKKIRGLGDKVISVLLTFGAIFIANEAYSRWASDTYVVWLPAVLIAVLFGLAIDLLRLRMLTQAEKRAPNSTISGLISHAKSDTWHSGIISIILLVELSGKFVGIESELYEFLVRLIDYLASLGLAGYMMFILSPRIWRGQGCGHDHFHHNLGQNCNHNH